MTETRTLTDRLSVTAFVAPAEIEGLAGQFGTIINNRPDGEEPGQATSAEIEAAAKEQGLCYRHIPVVAANIGEADVRAFERALEQGPSPVLAFCRTGTRSTMLWALSQAGKMSSEEIIETAKGAGYDLDQLRPRIEAQATA